MEIGQREAEETMRQVALFCMTVKAINLLMMLVLHSRIFLVAEMNCLSGLIGPIPQYCMHGHHVYTMNQ